MSRWRACAERTQTESNQVKSIKLYNFSFFLFLRLKPIIIGYYGQCNIATDNRCICLLVQVLHLCNLVWFLQLVCDQQVKLQVVWEIGRRTSSVTVRMQMFLIVCRTCFNMCFTTHKHLNRMNPAGMHVTAHLSVLSVYGNVTRVIMTP